MIHWLHYFRPEARQNIMVVGACGRGSCSLPMARKQRGMEKEGPETRHTLQRYSLSDLLLPNRPHFLTVHSTINSSMG
jgi:hypothetical protein